MQGVSSKPDFGGPPTWGTFGFDFPPNDPKYLAEFVRALNYPHLMVWIQALIPDRATWDTQLQFEPRPIIDYMDVFPDWEKPFGGFQHRYWNVVKIDPDFNEVKITKTNRLS